MVHKSKKHAWRIYSSANVTTYRLNADYVTDPSKQAAAGQSSNWFPSLVGTLMVP